MDERLWPKVIDTREQEHGKEYDQASRCIKDNVSSFLHGIIIMWTAKPTRERRGVDAKGGDVPLICEAI
jgi:hypothetical protein